jgi:hypothetical protein|tara:strand:- start:1270 stop:1641 length:372 start_codon:yes stop_codon:yes gene_type:complete
MTKTEENKKVLLDALERSLGIVTTACRSVKLSRTQFYEWMDNDPKFAAKFKDIKEMQKDFVESELFQTIKDREHPAQGANIRFYLGRIAKDRGYVERQEITGAEGMPTNFQIEIIDSANETKD